MAAPAATEMVMVSAARLAELEALVDITAEMKKKLLKFNHSSIERLKKYKETHPDNAEKICERSQRYRERDREAYNARRREQRRLKKEAAASFPCITHDGDDDA